MTRHVDTSRLLALANDELLGATSRLLAAKLRTATMSGLLPGEQTTYLALRYVDEIRDGGHHQFFWDGAGDATVATIAAVREVIGAHIAGILSSAVARFGASAPSAELEPRRAQMSKLRGKQRAFAEDDGAFFDQRAVFVTVIAEFVRTHGEAFELPALAPDSREVLEAQRYDASDALIAVLTGKLTG